MQPKRIVPFSTLADMQRMEREHGDRQRRRWGERSAAAVDAERRYKWIGNTVRERESMREQATTTYRGVAVLRGTAKAVLVRFENRKEALVPQSVIHDDSPSWQPGDRGDLVVLEWWAQKLEAQWAREVERGR